MIFFDILNPRRAKIPECRKKSKLSPGLESCNRYYEGAVSPKFQCYSVTCMSEQLMMVRYLMEHNLSARRNVLSCDCLEFALLFFWFMSLH